MRYILPLLKENFKGGSLYKNVSITYRKRRYFYE